MMNTIEMTVSGRNFKQYAASTTPYPNININIRWYLIILSSLTSFWYTDLKKTVANELSPVDRVDKVAE